MEAESWHCKTRQASSPDVQFLPYCGLGILLWTRKFSLHNKKPRCPISGHTRLAAGKRHFLLHNNKLFCQHCSPSQRKCSQSQLYIRTGADSLFRFGCSNQNIYYFVFPEVSDHQHHANQPVVTFQSVKSDLIHLDPVSPLSGTALFPSLCRRKPIKNRIHPSTVSD